MTISYLFREGAMFYILDLDMHKQALLFSQVFPQTVVILFYY